jgi:hypothetical protein
MVPPKAAQRGKIVAVFIQPNADGSPGGTVVGEQEFLVDLPEGVVR